MPLQLPLVQATVFHAKEKQEFLFAIESDPYLDSEDKGQRYQISSLRFCLSIERDEVLAETRELTRHTCSSPREC